VAVNAPTILGSRVGVDANLATVSKVDFAEHRWPSVTCIRSRPYLTSFTYPGNESPVKRCKSRLAPSTTRVNVAGRSRHVVCEYPCLCAGGADRSADE
jgi:hypothetical protein